MNPGLEQYLSKKICVNKFCRAVNSEKSSFCTKCKGKLRIRKKRILK